MVLIQDGNQVFDWMLNQKATYIGDEADLGATDPTTMGATYFCQDSGKMYLSSNGVDWDWYVQLTGV